MSCSCRPVTAAAGGGPVTSAQSAGAATAPAAGQSAVADIAVRGGATAYTGSVAEPDTRSEAERMAQAAADARFARAANPGSVHMTQFANDRYNPDGPLSSGDCAIVSSVMALRLAGLDIKGFDGQRKDAVIVAARKITGKLDRSQGTNSDDVRKIIETSGGKTAHTHDFEKGLKWVQQGKPIVLSGNSARAWGKDYSHSEISKFDGAHSVTITGYDPFSGAYIVNDPLSRIGPIPVSAEQLKAYASAPGLGEFIAVSKK